MSSSALEVVAAAVAGSAGHQGYQQHAIHGQASEQAAEHPDKPEIAGKVKDVAGVHKTLWPEETAREQIIKTVKRFVVRADEELTAFLELERAICVGLLTEQI